VVISGPSGVGKGTIIESLLKKMPDLVFSISATTRSKRAEEKEGVHYFFISRREFQKRIEAGAFLEWAKVHDDFYGTPRPFIDTHLSMGRTIILDIDVQGGLQVKKNFQDALFIFIVPPTFDELWHRLKKRRTEKPSEIERRLKDAREELGHLVEYDYIVINNDLKPAVEDVYSIIRAEQCKKSRRLQEIRHALSAD